MIEKYSLEIEKIKENISNIVLSGYEEIDDILKIYFSSSGKMIRPILTLIFSKLGEKNKKYEKEIIDAASLLEIIHATTLIHDDIIDNAKTRRGKETIGKKHGEKTAIFIGDYLFSVVLREISNFSNVNVHKYLSYTLKEICMGEIFQSKDLYNVDTRVLDYFKKIRRKTALLIAYSCILGGIVSNSDKKYLKKIYLFGYYLGMSYQIIDDYLDFMAKEEVLGKQVGQDLLNGNITLPVILKIKKEKNKFLDLKNLDYQEKLKLIKEIKNDQEILNKVKEISNNYLKKAKSQVKIFPMEIKKDLEIIIEKLSNRSY